MTDYQVTLFCGFCIESLWSTFHCLNQSVKLNVNKQIILGIDEHLDATWDSLLDKKKIEVFTEDFYEDAILHLESEINWGIPTHVACYYILNTTIDIITSLAEQDIQYLKEYVSYRNMDFIRVWEENTESDIKDEHNPKSNQIKQLYNNEFIRQIKFVEFVLTQPNKMKIKSFREKLKKNNLTES